MFIIIAAVLIVGCYGEQGAEPTPGMTALTSARPETDPPVTGEAAPGGRPVVDGSAAALPLARRLAEVYGGMSARDAAAYTAISGTAEAYENLARGGADVLIAYLPPDDTLAALRERGVRLSMKPIALDALVFVVSASNPVTDISDAQLRAIYAGNATRWSELGGADAEIRAYQRAEGAAGQTMLLQLLMRGDKPMEPPRLPEPGAEGGKGAPADYDNAPDAIGFSQYYYVTRLYRAQDARILSVDGVAPDPRTIADGAYPYVASLYAVLREDAPPRSPARALYDFLSTPEGRRLIGEEGYIAAPEEEDGDGG